MYRRLLPIVVLLLVVMNVVALADEVFEDWNGGDPGGWIPNTSESTVEWMAAGGVDDSGYLHTAENPEGYNLTGAVQLNEPYVGDFGARGYVRMACAIRFFAGNFISAVFRLRYLDPGHNGWYISLTDDFSPGAWQEVGVIFDRDWSDADAVAAGWVQEPDSASFAETMANVYSIHMNFSGTGDLETGLDNFLLSDEFLATENSTWSAVKTIYR